jgi:hypothetical protein
MIITVKDRINLGFGSIPESYFERDCTAANIPYISTKTLSIWTPEYDLIYGDYEIHIQYKNKLVDVKGGAIARSSIIGFQGDYFVAFDSSNPSAKNPYVILPQILKDLIRYWPNNYFDVLEPSKDLGILYSRLTPLFSRFIPLDKFLQGTERY